MSSQIRLNRAVGLLEGIKWFFFEEGREFSYQRIHEVLIEELKPNKK